jgi:hypothetical protein
LVHVDVQDHESSRAGVAQAVKWLGNVLGECGSIPGRGTSLLSV